MSDGSRNEIPRCKELASTAGNRGTDVCFGAALELVAVTRLSKTNMMNLPDSPWQIYANREAAHGRFVRIWCSVIMR